ncbi:MAG: hypothetical protein QOE90_2312 [Thermoplasmata archaeon]|jgi:hypothetical protein|nr:hypothetical protein [Thermoplasmata archaeon]
MHLRLASLFLMAVVLAGCTSSTPSATVPSLPVANPAGDISTASVSNASGSGGGNVRDVAATVPTFTDATATTDNSGSGIVSFSGTVSDANGESDLAFVFVKGTTFNATNGVQTLGVNHTINGTDRSLTSEPGAFGSDGYKVWDCGTRDGILCFKYNLQVAQFAQAGTYTFNVTSGKNSSVVQSAVGLVGTTVVTSFSQIDFAPYPVDTAGAVQTGSNWGAWTANPGDTNVVAGNYLKLTNNGDVPNARVQISFSGTAFVGASDGSWTVPFANNVQFATCDAAAGVAPSACTFSGWSAANAGAVTVTFGGKGHVIYVQYRVVQMPATLPAQSYGASFTATEL